MKSCSFQSSLPPLRAEILVLVTERSVKHCAKARRGDVKIVRHIQKRRCLKMAIYSHERQRLSICSFGATRKQRSKRLRNSFLFFRIVQKDSLQSGRERLRKHLLFSVIVRANNLQSGRKRLRNHQTASQAAILYFMM